LSEKKSYRDCLMKNKKSYNHLKLVASRSGLSKVDEQYLELEKQQDELEEQARLIAEMYGEPDEE
jgi:hypothetical protein